MKKKKVDPLFISLSKKTWGLLQNVRDGEATRAPYLNQISRHPRVDEILLWLANNKIIGSRFVSWILVDNQKSLARGVEKILKELDHNLHQKPIYVGKAVKL